MNDFFSTAHCQSVVKEEIRCHADILKSIYLAAPIRQFITIEV